MGPSAALASRLRAIPGGLDNMLTVRGVAERLGLSTATIYALCERGELPHAWISNSIRVSAADLGAFLTRCRKDNSHE